MSMEEQRSNREDFLRQQRQTQDRVRRIDDSKMRRLQVGVVVGSRSVGWGACLLPGCCLPVCLRRGGACPWRAPSTLSISLLESVEAEVLLGPAPTSPFTPPLQLVQALEQRHRGITSAWKWLQENRPRFRGAVYGPIALEVECPDPQHVQYLEQHVGGEHGLAVWLWV
jgi:hypothetical protein